MKFGHWYAYSLLAFAQMTIAVNVIAAKYILPHVPFYLFLTTRFFISGLFLSACVYFLKGRLISDNHPQARLQLKDWCFLIAQAFTGGFLFNYLFFQGIQYTTATSAGIISSALPAMIAVCAFLCLGEKLNASKKGAIVLAIVGILIISLDNFSDAQEETGSFFGDFLILLSMLPEALYSIFNKFISHRVTPLGSAAVVNWFIFLMLLPLCLVSLYEDPINIMNFSLSVWGLLILSGLCGGYFYWAWSKGLSLVPASTAAVFGGVLPVGTSILAFIFLEEGFGWYNFFGMICVLASIAVVAKSSVPQKVLSRIKS